MQLKFLVAAIIATSLASLDERAEDVVNLQVDGADEFNRKGYCTPDSECCALQISRNNKVLFMKADWDGVAFKPVDEEDGFLAIQEVDNSDSYRIVRGNTEVMGQFHPNKGFVWEGKPRWQFEESTECPGRPGLLERQSPEAEEERNENTCNPDSSCCALMMGKGREVLFMQAESNKEHVLFKSVEEDEGIIRNFHEFYFIEVNDQHAEGSFDPNFGFNWKDKKNWRFEQVEECPRGGALVERHVTSSRDEDEQKSQLTSCNPESTCCALVTRNKGTIIYQKVKHLNPYNRAFEVVGDAEGFGDIIYDKGPGVNAYSLEYQGGSVYGIFDNGKFKWARKKSWNFVESSRCPK